MGNNASVSIAVLFVGLLVALGVQLSALMTLNTRTTRLTRSARSNLLLVTGTLVSAVCAGVVASLANGPDWFFLVCEAPLMGLTVVMMIKTLRAPEMLPPVRARALARRDVRGLWRLARAALFVGVGLRIVGYLTSLVVAWVLGTASLGVAVVCAVVAFAKTRRAEQSHE